MAEAHSSRKRPTRRARIDSTYPDSEVATSAELQSAYTDFDIAISQLRP